MIYSHNKELVEKINLLRKKLETLILKNNYELNEEIVKMSQKLDRVLVAYYNQNINN